MGDLPPGISQELPDEALSALCRSHRASRQAIDFPVVAGRAQDQFEIAQDSGQEIVEIVRDPSGQLTDSFEALGLRERLARARQLGVAFLRDCESLIKAAVKAARFDKESDRHEANGKKAVKVAGIKPDAKTPGIKTLPSAPSNLQADNDTHKPQIGEGKGRPRPKTPRTA